jgi:hypothetical protein
VSFFIFVHCLLPLKIKETPYKKEEGKSIYQTTHTCNVIFTIVITTFLDLSLQEQDARYLFFSLKIFNRSPRCPSVTNLIFDYESKVKIKFMRQKYFAREIIKLL